MAKATWKMPEDFLMKVSRLADKTDEIIFCDLKYIRNVIYFDEIKNTGLEMTLTKALKKLNIID